jgi:hypothetical protein
LFVCANDGCDAVGSSKRVASDGSIVHAVINIFLFEVAEMRDFGEFQSIRITLSLLFLFPVLKITL